MKRLTIVLGLVACFALQRNQCLGYEMRTHYSLSDEAFAVSDLAQPNRFAGLGLRVRSSGQRFPTTGGENDNDFAHARPPCSHASPESVRRLIACGAMFEDAPGERSLRHFFDPAHNGRGLTVLGVSWTPSPDWALEDRYELSGQEFSYFRAQRYLSAAVKTPGPASAVGGRNEQWGKLFQTLGQIIHHIQDMAQPQHVRNDAHFDGFSWLGDATNIGVRHPSRFEKYSAFNNLGQARVEAQLASGNFEPVYPRYRQVFRTARDFWTGSAGVADYTNANFVSQRTNFAADNAGRASPHPGFAQPVPLSSQDLTVVAAFAPDPVPPTISRFCADVGVDNCMMKFHASNVTDNLSGATVTNPRASTESVFDEDLRVVLRYSLWNESFETSRIFALNRLNFDAAYPFLIPKAVNYSAGLINFFFRGQMSIAPTSAGVYAIADQATEGCADSCGFRQVKLQVTNASPDETMETGIVSAIVKYHRNTCYQPDFAGQPPSFGCRTTDEEIAVSRPLPLESPLASGDKRELTFTFDAPIPINATDVFLQVVFEGRLGMESFVVAVGTKDISEPTFITTYNATDYVALAGGCFKADVVASRDDLWSQLVPLCRDTNSRRVSSLCANMPLNLRYSGGSAEHSWRVAMEIGQDGDRRLPPRRLARFAVLADGGSPIAIRLGFNNPPLYLSDDGALQFPAYEFEERLDGSRVEDTYVPTRGVDAWNATSIVIDGTTGAVGRCAEGELDALLESERPPAAATIVGW